MEGAKPLRASPKPPATGAQVQVIKPLSSLVKKAITLAMSSGCATRPSGTAAAILWVNAVGKKAALPSVATPPGDTTLAVIPRGPSSTEKLVLSTVENGCE
jgi:hypothetical protein